ncbi:hypothetical protein F4777DRAFT_96443 [Nemania sp. FL0916]|nr:hypothetical protein F4777DRAFT_96443 [Nemania sp. FL0916]
MATNGNGPSPGRNERPSEQLCDRAIDPWYSNGEVDLKIYAEKPWEHCGNLLNAYLSSRFEKLDEFKAEVTDDKWERIQHELERISSVRKRFKGSNAKKRLMKDLDESRKKLRDSLWSNIPQREEEVRRRLHKHKPVDKERLDYELAVLKRLRSKTRPNDEMEQIGKQKEREGLDGFIAGAMFFKKTGSSNSWKGISNPDYGDARYPNQKVEMRDILDLEKSPLAIPLTGSELRYFHLPANNMEWVEKAMVILCGGDPDKPDATSKTGHILGRGVWRGQMYGTGERGIPSHGTRLVKVKEAGPIHARHMRSRCSVFPHGATAAKPKHSSESTEDCTPDQTKNGGKNIALFLPYLHWETSSRRARMARIVDEVTRPQEEKEEKKKKTKHLADVVNAQKNSEKKKKRLYRHDIGDYLMAVAKVAEEQDYEDDENLLRSSISAKAPLHIRRTLDQYYFPTLEDTSVRDRDQVVYRGTKYGSPRVVMVDQLWLWIINDNTIITSFPRRWGRNKPDPSGVHKSLRERLEHEEINSIHHLALIIIDQCSRVFFDRTKPLDQRPEVLDLFASAIGHVTEQTAVAYESFWRNLSIESSIAPSVYGNFSHHKRLDINPEGLILQEAQDIAEELRIMGQVFTDQWKVTKDLKRYLNSPDSEWNEQPKEFAAMQKLLAGLLEQRNAAAERESSGTSTQNPDGRTAAVNIQQTAHEARVLLEHIEDRQAELKDLEDSALRTCQQLERLLSLKQQQASIVEAKAALRRADESVKQGRAIMAFTLVTIFFLPLGFIATFFGMNNREINDADWMSLDEQIRYMFIIIVSVAFSAWPRAVARLLVHVPWVWFGEHTGLYHYWKSSPMHHEKLDRRASKFLGGAELRKHKEKKALSNRNSDQLTAAAYLQTADLKIEETSITTSATLSYAGKTNGEIGPRKSLRDRMGFSNRSSQTSCLA